MKPFVILSALLLAPLPVFGQAGLDPSVILKSLTDQWPTYSGDYTGKRYSGLKQVNRSTVKDLSLSWVTRFTRPAAGPGLAVATRVEAVVLEDAVAAVHPPRSSWADWARAT